MTLICMYECTIMLFMCLYSLYLCLCIALTPTSNPVTFLTHIYSILYIDLIPGFHSFRGLKKRPLDETRKLSHYTFRIRVYWYFSPHIHMPGDVTYLLQEFTNWDMTHTWIDPLDHCYWIIQKGGVTVKDKHLARESFYSQGQKSIQTRVHIVSALKQRLTKFAFVLWLMPNDFTVRNNLIDWHYNKEKENNNFSKIQWFSTCGSRGVLSRTIAKGVYISLLYILYVHACGKRWPDKTFPRCKSNTACSSTGNSTCRWKIPTIMQQFPWENRFPWPNRNCSFTFQCLKAINDLNWWKAIEKKVR